MKLSSCVQVLVAELVCLALLNVGDAAVPSPGTERGPVDFALQDFINRKWRNECVTFPLNRRQLKLAKEGSALIDSGGKVVPYQLYTDRATGKTGIALLTDLDPWEIRTFSFAPGKKIEPSRTDLRVEESPEAIRLTNGLTGIAVAKTLSKGQGPIQGIRLSDGNRWVGSSFVTGDTVTTYKAEVTARGPVLAEVICRATFGEKGTWELRLRLQAGEPLVVADESFNCGGSGLQFVLSLSDNLSPDTIFYRTRRDGCKIARVSELKGQLYVLEPWFVWWGIERQGRWFGLYKESDRDLLVVGALNAELWVDPAIPSQERAAPQLCLSADAGKLQVPFPMKRGSRRWFIGILDKDLCLAPLGIGGKKADPSATPTTLPQQYLIKHGDFPLDVVKDYTLQWRPGSVAYPRLFIDAEERKRIRAEFKSDTNEVQKLIVQSKSNWLMPLGALEYAIACGDAALGAAFADCACRLLQAKIDEYVNQPGYYITISVSPHTRGEPDVAGHVAEVVDLALAFESLAPQVRERIRAQMAFLAYVVNRPDYWSPERGFAANPNMTTLIAYNQTVCAAVIPDHPQSAIWMRNAMKELYDNELLHWSDKNGGWLEAPHYGLVSFEFLLGAFLAAHNGGYNDYLYDPRLKKIAEWHAKLLTPPDARFKDLRLIPPIGNSYINERPGIFGNMAYWWKDRDPEFAGQMQWLWQQLDWCNLEYTGSMNCYRPRFLDRTIPARIPDWKSELFPQAGVILRNGFPGQRETRLYMIAGRLHEHYDYDSGSVTIWGKGRIVADDFGYQGRMPAADHNMIESPLAPQEALMEVEKFAPGERLDYVCGRKAASQRQIAFVKDPDPLGPNYFLIADTLKRPTPAPSVWRMWFSADKVEAVAPGQYLATGREDVDTDIVFCRPTNASFRTESKTRSITQLGLLAEMKHAEGFATLIYPRLKTDARPVFTALAEGRGIRIESTNGTDYVFLDSKPFAYTNADVEFEGTAGLAQIRGKDVFLALGDDGRIACHGKTLKRGKPVFGGTPAASRAAEEVKTLKKQPTITGQGASSNSMAVFVKVDDMTRGNWEQNYGKLGYLIPGSAKDAEGVTVGLEGHIGGHWLIWEQQTDDERALHKPGNTKERLAACWYSWDKPLYIKIRMDKASRRAIALYLLDWDTLHGGRAGKVEVLDPTDNHVLDSRGIDEYDYGRYMVWNVSGPVTFRLTSANMASTAVSGIFIDEPIGGEMDQEHDAP